ncbi:MAG: hypothetical protein EOP48_22540 [Sphingobacteriales bacterium]|nr:MAG: hypothetical protein EOP48_22540 [Sphingobacteriales bacterium]
MQAYNSNEQPIVQFRSRKLKAVNDYYNANGFPQPCSLPELSLFPAYFQEAIYDGINWIEQNAELQHLDKELELDCMFQNRGKTRKELSPKEFEDYIKFSGAAINRTSTKPKKTLLSRLWQKLG